jgi:cytoskeletal protein CcmA (bactofilin family)
MRRRGTEQEYPQEAAPRAPEYSPSPVAGEMTVIGRGARLEGNLISAGSLRIEGSVKGQITAEGDVILADGSEVAADVKANNVTVGGHYSGNVTAAGTLELESSAKVDGNVSCQSLIVNRGASLSGQTMMNESVATPLPEQTASAEAEE